MPKKPSNILTLRIDPQLRSALQGRADQTGLSLAAAARDLIREGLGTTETERGAGFQEGIYAGLAKVRQAMSQIQWEE